jgi:Protein of unknown function (DUF3551)
MRCWIIFAAVLLAVPASAALATPSATAAPSPQPQQYCGFNPKPGSLVECGYSSRQSCETAIGKGAMCFVNPYIAMNTPRAIPLVGHSEG